MAEITYISYDWIIELQAIYQLFAVMDNLIKGYYQATSADSSKHFTAFITLAGMCKWGLREHLIISRDLWQV